MIAVLFGDVLLNMYERGYTQKEYDAFFNKLKEELVPFVRKVCSLPKQKYDFSKFEYDIETQKKVAKYIGDALCFDFDRGTMGETEHPFTWNTSSNDVRITNHFYLNEFSFSLFSAIHEFGHATYEQNVDPKYNGTFIGSGVSMAMHESQSRFYENIIGRNYNFWKVHFPKIKEFYSEQFKDVTLEEFYKYVNFVETSYIRTEADELTYPLHIMLRYELEKELISGKLEVKDLEKAWNEKFEEYFGLKVTKSSLGVLQDSHWSGGSIGYFPTYALGSAIASQMYYKMNEEFNVEETFETGNTKKINEWLTNKVHKFGSSKYPKEILKIALNEEFDAKYYIEYLINKYSKIYNI
jgi:carboxypeptidase Taq